MKIKLVLSLLYICSTTILNAQIHKNQLPRDLINYFLGTWSGNGEFKNGKKISADLTFKLSLDSNWIIYEHNDNPPNRYKALFVWGIDALSGQFVAYTFDNFNGHKSFTSNGWVDGKLILTTHEYFPNKGLIFQHFIYEKLSDASFKMTYETSTDAITWKLGDYLVFNKN